MSDRDSRSTLTEKSSASQLRLWTGFSLGGLAAVFLLLDGGMKLLKSELAVKATVELGYPVDVIMPLGIVLVIATILYLVPKTTVLGAILLTGYLGGAVATHVRVASGLFPIVFPIILGIMLWGGIYFRDERVTRLLPLRSTN